MFRDAYRNEMMQFPTQVCKSIASTFHSSMRHSGCTFFQFSFKLSALLLSHWDLIKWVLNRSEKETILCKMHKGANYSSVTLYCSMYAFWQVGHWRKGSNDENCKGYDCPGLIFGQWVPQTIPLTFLCMGQVPFCSVII